MDINVCKCRHHEGSKDSCSADKKREAMGRTNFISQHHSVIPETKRIRITGPDHSEQDGTVEESFTDER